MLDGNTTFTALDNQQSTLTIYANDTAGNVNSTTVTFTIDTNPPTITFVYPTPENDSTTQTIFTFINTTSSEPLSSAVLEWNSTENVTMSGSVQNHYYNNTYLPSATTHIASMQAIQYIIGMWQNKMDFYTQQYTRNTRIYRQTQRKRTHRSHFQHTGRDDFGLSGYIFSRTLDAWTNEHINHRTPY